MKIRSALPRLLAAPLLTLALAAGAAPVYLIDATTDGLPLDISSFANFGFSLTYEDFNQDASFSLNELLAFTGVSDSSSNYFDQLLGTPAVFGVSGTGDAWVFGDSNGLLANFSAAAGAFTPFTTGPVPGSDPITVPEPGALALCLLGFAALGASRRTARRTAG